MGGSLCAIDCDACHITSISSHVAGPIGRSKYWSSVMLGCPNVVACWQLLPLLKRCAWLRAQGSQSQAANSACENITEAKVQRLFRLFRLEL